MHGSRSYAYEFEKYILALQKEGFELVVFEAPGHGTSDGKRINAYIKKALDTIESLYGPFYGVMGHSLGSLLLSWHLKNSLTRQTENWY